MSIATLRPEDLLDAFPLPGVLTDLQGRCLAHNRGFEAALLQPRHARLAVGRLRFELPAVQVAWEAALAEAGATGAPGTAVLELVGRQVELQVSAVPTPLDPALRLLLAVFAERSARADPLRALHPKGRLTHAEREVLAALLRGLPAKAIALERGASVNTVRAQIVSILDKTGHGSQRELLAAYGASSFGQSVFGDSQQRLS